MEQRETGPGGQDARDTAERLYLDWEAAFSSNDLDRLLGLYAEDAVLESPLVPHLLGVERGICRGRDELRRLFETLVIHRPWLRQYHRAGSFTDGHKVVIEYPGSTPDGEQIDAVEVMHLRDGLIHHHKVYWGWRGVQVLARNEYDQ